jgi:hypothetical protein
VKEAVLFLNSATANSPRSEKEPKKLLLPGARVAATRAPNGQKFFASFFQKRRFFL